jgi:hypothetical protein
MRLKTYSCGALLPGKARAAAMAQSPGYFLSSSIEKKFRSGDRFFS